MEIKFLILVTRAGWDKIVIVFVLNTNKFELWVLNFGYDLIDI